LNELKEKILFIVLIYKACLPNPCLNGGQPSNQGGSCYCQCPQGYSGSRCENRDRNFYLYFSFKQFMALYRRKRLILNVSLFVP